jgi:hypothetical protein
MEDRQLSNMKYKGRFSNYRMIPQGASLYFYSYDGIPFVNPKEAIIDIDPILRQHIASKFEVK